MVTKGMVYTMDEVESVVEAVGPYRISATSHTVDARTSGLH